MSNRTRGHPLRQTVFSVFLFLFIFVYIAAPLLYAHFCVGSSGLQAGLCWKNHGQLLASRKTCGGRIWPAGRGFETPALHKKGFPSPARGSFSTAWIF
uniref:Putative secreted protein n=1 Tax=Ixodes scapularis TaxID=6945 RepID=A0A4D5RWV7_IXOSC